MTTLRFNGRELAAVTPCQPAKPSSSCAFCARLAHNVPANAWLRTRIVLLDVRAILPAAAACPLFRPTTH